MPKDIIDMVLEDEKINNDIYNNKKNEEKSRDLKKSVLNE